MPEKGPWGETQTREPTCVRYKTTENRNELRPNRQKIRSMWWSFAACMERMEYFVLSFFFELKHLMYLVRPVIAVAYNCWSNCRRKLVFLPKRMAGSWLANLTARLLTWSWQQVGKYCLVRRFKCTIENSSWPGCSLCDQRYVYMYYVKFCVRVLSFSLFFFFFRFYMTKIFYLIFLYLILNFFCPGSRALTKNETYHLYFSSFLIHQVVRREVAG